MKLTFYCLSGSPFSRRIWLALEHKQVSLDLVVLRRDAGIYALKNILRLYASLILFHSWYDIDSIEILCKND